MRIVLLLLCCLSIHALEIQVNFGKENDEDFSVLNLKHTQAFECMEEKNVHSEITSITCTIPKTPINNFVPTNTAFFNLSNTISANNLVLTIRPKYKAKLFATFLDLKSQNRIPKERPKKSKQWQIAGFISKLPFLSDKQTNGLNFPIAIPSNENLYIGQLDINLNPLHYEEGLDFQQLKEIKTLYDQQHFAKTEEQASKALKTYPSSIFAKDFLLYKIRALSHILSKETIDTLISSALEWIKNSPSDKNAPEVLYLLANAYMYGQIENEAIYYYKRIINEYPQDEWSALAKMQLAKHFSDNPLYKINSNLFAEAYAQAQSQAIKNKILLEWGTFLLEKNKNEAQRLIKTLFEKDPSYFAQNLSESSALLHQLIVNKTDELASQITSYLLQEIQNDSFREKLLYDLGNWYELADNTKEAYFYNQQFLKNYPNSKLAQLVTKRNNELLLKMGENLSQEEKLALYDSIIEKYPNTDVSRNAYLHKAQLLFELKRFKEVLELQSFIPNSSLIAQSKKEIILRLLKDSQCKQIPLYIQGSDLNDLTQDDQFALFDCLYSLSYYKDAKNLIQDFSQKEAKDQLPWIYRLSKVENKLGNFADSKKAGEDALSLAKTLKQQEFYDVGFVIFDDLSKLNFVPQAQKLSVFLDEHFKKDQRMLEVWYFLLKNAQKENDQNSVKIYAKTILDLQREVKFFDYTPNVDFIFIHTLIQEKQYQEAEQHIEKLLETKIAPKERQQALYIQGSLLKLMRKDSKKSFEECLKIQDKTNWRNLCEKSLKN